MTRTTSTSARLYTDIIGTGAPIVLLHGYMSSSHYFHTIRRRLARTHMVITIDLLGFGRSPKPDGRHSYEEHLATLHRTLQALHLDQPFVLIGHSAGALIAAKYAAIYSEEVARLQLFNPPIFKDRAEANQSFHNTGPHYRALLYSPLRVIYWRTLKLLPRSHPRFRPALNLSDPLRASRSAREGVFDNIILASDFLPLLRTLDRPALLVVGAHDRPEYWKNITNSQLPDNITVTLVPTGHHTLVKQPDLSERLIRTHLSN
jgi:pimeloyl-ACP methyl ester carboxylesterase